MDEERAAVVAEATTWLGTPFMHQQCVKRVGCDCLTMIFAVYRAVFPNLPTIEIPFYRPDEHLHRSGEPYANGIAKFCAKLPPTSEVLPGDLITFAFGRRNVAHVGVVVDREWFISAVLENGRVEQHRYSDHFWAIRRTGVWRLHQWVSA